MDDPTADFLAREQELLGADAALFQTGDEMFVSATAVPIVPTPVPVAAVPAFEPEFFNSSPPIPPANTLQNGGYTNGFHMSEAASIEENIQEAPAVR
jgi:hypothetical protein